MYFFDRLEEDARLVLSRVTKPWSVPAEAVRESILLQGWTYHDEPLPERHLCICDAWNKTILLSPTLVCPKVRNWLLATQLGRIRLQSRGLLKGLHNKPIYARNDTNYALAFLLPLSSMKAHPFMAAAPTVDEQTAQNLVDQASDYFQVPAICILAAYNFYTGLPSPPEQNSEDGWCSAKFPNPAFWASIWNGP